uniref:Fibronectin type-III domain-containing protein n=1 Tax=Oryzias latipes TaxID=8090 RepID=A0A3P9IPB7_ORYLA
MLRGKKEAALCGIRSVLDRPGAPLGPLTVSEITADNCVLTWSPPADDGGSKIEGYVIEKRESSRLVWTTVVSGLLVTQYKVTKLLKGNEYIFRIMASNKYGLGEPLESEPTIADNPYRIPDPPENPEVTVITKDSMVVMWQEPKNDGGTPITNFNIERKDRVGLRWVKCNKRKVKDLQFKTTGLVPSHEYEFRITAENAAGVSAPSVSSPFYKATDALYKPGPPCNPRVLDTTKSSITVAWNKPSYDGGSDISGYIVETCSLSASLATIDSTPSYTSLVIENVNRFDSGKYNLTVENSSGSKTATVQVRVLDTPSAPQNLKITAVTNEAVTLTWDPPMNDGGVKIKNYIVEKRESTRKAYATVNANCHNTTFTVDQLLEGCNYYFRVLAENEYGIGLPIESIESVKVSEKPQPPGKITLKDVTKNKRNSILWVKINK